MLMINRGMIEPLENMLLTKIILATHEGEDQEGKNLNGENAIPLIATAASLQAMHSPSSSAFRKIFPPGDHEPGSYEIPWDGRDEAGQLAPTGLYFYHLHAGNFVRALKLTLVR